jgi:hypothetical protein
LIGHKVVCGIGAVGASGKAHEKLDTLVERAILEALGPLVKGKACRRLGTFGEPPLSRALISVVELSEDIVEGRPGNSIVQVSIRDKTLRCRGDQHVGAEFLDIVDKLSVVLRLLDTFSSG